MTQARHKGLTALFTGGCTRSAVPDASPVPSGTPSAARTTSAPVDVRRVDGASATIRLPDGRDDKDCPVGAVTLTDGRWAESGQSGPGEIRGSYRDGPQTYGDLDGDGRAEAVVHVSCWAAGGDSGDSSGQLLVVNGRDGSLRGMGYVPGR